MPNLGDDSFGSYHPEAVGEIYDAGFQTMEDTSDEIDTIMADAEERAAELEEEAQAAAAIGDEEEALALEAEAVMVVDDAIASCVALVLERAEEGAGEMLDMCANNGQTTIITASIPSFHNEMLSLAPIGLAE